MLEFDGRDRGPGLAHAAEKHLQDQFDDAGLGWREQPPRGQWPHAPTESTEKAVQRAENHRGLNHHHRVAAQGVHAQDVHRKRRTQALQIVAKTHDLDPGRVDARAGPKNLEHAQAKQPDEALIDHVQRREVDPQAGVF